MLGSRVRRRRRGILLGKVLVGLVLAAISGGLLAAGMAEDRIHEYRVEAVVLDDGSALVRETIDYDFGIRPARGILRDIPTGGDSDAVTDVVVRSASANDDVLVTPGFREVEIRIGDPDKRATGRHQYVIEYQLADVVDGRELALNVIGTGWDVPIDAVDATITAPFELDSVVCHQGRGGSTSPCDTAEVDGDTMTIAADGLSAGDGITVYAGAGAPVGAPVTALQPDVELDSGDSFWWLRTIATVLAIGAAGYIVGLVVVTRWARRVGRDYAWFGPGGPADSVFARPDAPVRRIDGAEADRYVTIQFVPPRGFVPSQGGMILRPNVSDDHRTAWLTQQAIDGLVAIEDDEKGETAIRWTGPDGPRSTAPAPLQKIFDGRDHVSLGKYDKKFAEGWKLIGKELETWREASGLWDMDAEEQSRRTQAKLVLVGLVAGIAGGAWLWWTADSGVVLPVAGAIPASILVGVAVAALGNDRELPVRTPPGFAVRQQVAGFRRFFVGSEARHAQEAASRGVLREYSAWAVALGELGHWNRAMSSASLPPSTPGVADVARITALSSAARTASTAPSSSGGSSGGGGGVGGGSGGGGGGRW